MIQHGVLTVRLITDGSFGTTSPSTFGPDVTVVTDANGLPFIPQRRLAARLHESALRASRTFGDGAAVDKLFGAPGLLNRHRALGLGAATLSSTLVALTRGWIDRQRSGHVLYDYSEDVTAALTVDQTTTRVDDYGAPTVGSRREMRYARAGLVFFAPFEIDHTNSDLLAVLARACLGCDQLGGGETRGFGVVEIAIDGDFNRTRELAKGVRSGPGMAPSDRSPTGTSPKSAGGAVDTHTPARVDSAPANPAEPGTVRRILPAVLTLTDDLIINAEAGPRSLSIPGAALRGAMAALLKDQPETLQRLILAGVVRFSDAFPCVDSSDGPVPLFPVPANAYINEQGRLVDLLDMDATSGPVAQKVKRLDGSLTASAGAFGSPSVVLIQRVNRSTNLYFESWALAGGQQFATELQLVGTEAEVTSAEVELRTLDATKLRVGGNARSGFGGALSLTFGALSGRSFLQPRSAPDVEGDTFDGVLRSAALVRSPETGQFDPGALPVRLVELVQHSLPDHRIEVVTSVISTARVGGFNARYGGLRPEHAAAAAGSVVRLRVEGLNHSNQGSLAAAQLQRLGERTVDGFGTWSVGARLQGAPKGAAVRAGHVGRGKKSTTEAPVVSALEHGTALDIAELFRSNGLADLANHLTEHLPGSTESAPSPGAPTRELGADRAVAVPSVPAGPPKNWSNTVIEIGFTLTLLSDTTIAGLSEQAEARDGVSAEALKLHRNRSGQIVLRGTTVAGVLRHHLRRSVGLAPFDPDSAEVHELLGGLAAEGDAARMGAGVRSSLALFDSVARLPAGWEVRVRIRNRVNPQTGVVADGALFAAEVLPAGTTFECRWLGRVPDDEGARARWWRLLCSAAGALADGPDGVRFGVASGKGRGLARASGWAATVYDLATEAGFFAYYGVGAGSRNERVPKGVYGALRDALKALLGTTVVPITSRALRVVVSATMSIAEPADLQYRLADKHATAEEGADDAGWAVRPGTLHHGASTARSRVASDPPLHEGLSSERENVRHLLESSRRTGGKNSLQQVDSGTAWHSALKREALRISKAVAAGDAASILRAGQLVEGLFGSLDAVGNEDRERTLPSRVRVTEPVLSGSTLTSLHRIRVNPLTQAPVAGLLFEDKVVIGGKSRLEITVHRPQPAELGLLWAVLRDYRDGLGTPTGGLTAVGHGRRLLSAIAVRLHGPDERPLEVEGLAAWSTAPEIGQHFDAFLARVAGSEPPETGSGLP